MQGQNESLKEISTKEMLLIRQEYHRHSLSNTLYNIHFLNKLHVDTTHWKWILHKVMRSTWISHNRRVSVRGIGFACSNKTHSFHTVNDLSHTFAIRQFSLKQLQNHCKSSQPHITIGRSWFVTAWNNVLFLQQQIQIRVKESTKKRMFLAFFSWNNIITTTSGL